MSYAGYFKKKKKKKNRSEMQTYYPESTFFYVNASAESRSMRGASHQPTFRDDCLAICHTYLHCLPREWISFCVSGTVEVGADAAWI